MEACRAGPVSQAKGGPSGPWYEHKKCPTGLPKPEEGRAQDPNTGQQVKLEQPPAQGTGNKEEQD